MDINCLLFDKFETLDLFGPVEVFGGLEEYTVKYFSMNGGIIYSVHNVPVMTQNVNDMDLSGILLVPGGRGTRILVDDLDFISRLKNIAEKSTWCLTVCTGSGLIAKTGLLDGHNATSNKIAFEWAKSTGENVNWIYKARWVVDEKYYTSSGVSAGIDMSLGFLADRLGEECAKTKAISIEYEWNNDKNNDPFAIQQ
ncbi:MAG: DJ-1/PfpI family protein [Planctomycetaceae bacterium]|jgi:putative intracellular protease/amidase|nr:DJ-1/PfpI family protein [Planctomycetaceae bacterium]